AGYVQRGSAFFESQPIVWSAGQLTVLPGISATAGAAFEASRGGRVIVGNSGNQAAVWTREGYHELRAMLLAMGATQASGWGLRICEKISADGRTLVGRGTGPSSQFTAWVATLPPAVGCYANCDGSTAAPILNIADFACFMNR